VSVQAGVWNCDGAPIDSEFLKGLSKSLERHGPDGECLNTYGSVALLYRPFHTTPESRRERQPHLSRRGCLITWDGRVDNREELISELGADVESNATDIAIVGASFDRWGSNCFKRITGDWAVTIWSPAERKLILARDYVGVRSLYYLLTPKSATWCTNLEALILASRSQFTVSDRYIAGYLFLWPEADLTPYREIQAVPPGSSVEIVNGEIVVRRHWELNSKPAIRYRTDADYEEHFRQVFRQAVRRRLRSDTPVLAELSGGLDSSSIVCIADDIIEKEEGMARLDTTSRYDPIEPGGDERTYFSKVEERRGRVGFHVDKSKYPLAFPLDFHEFVATPGSMGNRPSNHPDPQLVEYRVLLSGTGGDEVTGGIPDPRPQIADLVLTLRWRELGSQLLAWSLIKRRPWMQLLWQSLILCLPLSIRMRMKEENKPTPWLQGSFLSQHWMAIREMGRASGQGLRLPTKRDYGETLSTLSRQMGLRIPDPHGCQERRYPYLDQSLVEFLFSIPAEQLLRPGQRRSLMRRALTNVVPNEVLSRSTKSIGGRLYMALFENQWPELEALFASPVSDRLGYINAEAFLCALRAAKGGKAPHLVRLLRGIALEIWLRDLQRRRVIRDPISGFSASEERTGFVNLVPD